jgi:hypothetical protein
MRACLNRRAAMILLIQPSSIGTRCFVLASISPRAVSLQFATKCRTNYSIRLRFGTFPARPNASATDALRHSRNSFIIPIMFAPMIPVFVMCEMISIGVGRCCLAICTRKGTSREAVKCSSDVGESGTYTNQLLSLILVPSYPSYLSDDSAISQPPPSYQHDLPPSYSQKSNLEMV